MRMRLDYFNILPISQTEKFKPQCQKTCHRISAHRDDSDHPAHLQSLISIVTGAFWIAKCLQADNEDFDKTAQADLNFRWSHNSEGTVSHIEAHFRKNQKKKKKKKKKK